MQIEITEAEYNILMNALDDLQQKQKEAAKLFEKLAPQQVAAGMEMVQKLRSKLIEQKHPKVCGKQNSS